jgi:hypothetical protein
VNFAFSQPIELRTNELIEGVRSDVALILYGDDLDVLKTTGDALAGVLTKVPGAADVKVEQVAGLPMLRVDVDREAIARLGMNATDVLDAVETLGGTHRRPRWSRDDSASRFRCDSPRRSAWMRRASRRSSWRVPAAARCPSIRSLGRVRRGGAAPGEPRERPAAPHHRGQRAGAWTSRPSSPRPRRHHRRGRGPQGLRARLGRPVREPRRGLGPARPAGSAGAGPDLRPAPGQLPLGSRPRCSSTPTYPWP